jgi:predicted nucleotidyltransferase
VDVDPTNPLRALTPTVDADVLFVLAKTRKAMTGAKTAHNAGRSYAQVRHCLHRLVDTGMVLAEPHGNSVSYQLNRDHVLAPLVEAAASAAGEVEARIARSVQAWTLPAAAVVLFGSFARRDGHDASDVDLLLVRHDEIGEDDTSWTAQRHDLARAVRTWSGNNAQVIEMSVTELATALTREEDLIPNLRRDGVVLAGPSLTLLLAAPRPAQSSSASPQETP